jgi:ribA/ribD-fused uncharacterized protein
MKTLDGSEREIIRRLPNAKAAKTRGYKVKLRPNWDERKVSLMYLLVRLKFRQNKKLSKKLVKTGDVILEEGNFRHDNFWGSCYCPKCKEIWGFNYLGKILMKVRKEIRDENL